MVRVPTDRHGQAACPWTFPAETTRDDFIFRQIGGKFFAGAEDHGLIFLLPPATPLCLVQVNETLSPVSGETWRTENVHDIPAVAGAAQSLDALAKKGYQVVYLALADKALVYQRVRGWVRRQNGEANPPFPDGPVLSRFNLPWSERINRPWQKSAERLAQRLPLPPNAAITRHVAIAGTSDVAEQFHAAGWRTVCLGTGGAVPVGVVRANGWQDVTAKIEK